MAEADGFHQGELARQFLDADLTGALTATFALDLAEIAISYCKGHPFPPPADFTPATRRWVSCSREMSESAARYRHLIEPGALTTVCGHTASHPEVWRGNSTKPLCPACLRN